MADIFAVIADTTRRRMLSVLLERYLSSGYESGTGSVGEVSAAELATATRLPDDDVASALRVLADGGLVHVRAEGDEQWVTLDPGPLAEVDDWIAPFFLVGEADAVAAAAHEEDAGSFVFAAWSGSRVAAPLRRAARALPDASEVGSAVGRRLAETRARAGDALHEASARVERLTDRLPSALGERRPGHPRDDD